jgi:hypothetical protein
MVHMASEFIPDMWADDDPDVERFEQLYWLRSTGVDVDDELEALRRRREDEGEAFKALTGVSRLPTPMLIPVMPTQAERETAYDRAPVVHVDTRSGAVAAYEPRRPSGGTESG